MQARRPRAAQTPSCTPPRSERFLLMFVRHRPACSMHTPNQPNTAHARPQATRGKAAQRAGTGHTTQCSAHTNRAGARTHDLETRPHQTTEDAAESPRKRREACMQHRRGTRDEAPTHVTRIAHTAGARLGTCQIGAKDINTSIVLSAGRSRSRRHSSEGSRVLRPHQPHARHRHRHSSERHPAPLPPQQALSRKAACCVKCQRQGAPDEGTHPRSDPRRKVRAKT
jgi:hypothetical protein